MSIETLIYAYLAICTSMIVFNCVCVFVFRRRNKVLQKRSSRLEKRIMEQIQRLGAGEPVEESHLDFLRKKLTRTNHLMAFDETLDRLMGQEPEAVRRYITQISPVFTYLAVENKYRNIMKMTYFSYVIQKYRVIEGKPVNAIILVMTRLLKEHSLYCRENALRAIYSTGDRGCVLEALRVVDESNLFHHSKLLTDGLLTFSGDPGRLADTLWGAFDQFSTQMRVVILDYIRFSGVDMRRELLPLLADDWQDDELRFSCLRYFEKYPYEEAFPPVLSFAENPGENRWEYAAVAAAALSAYPCERSVEVLKKDLRSSNWYIRFNAARSLESFHLTYLELSDVMDGNDRYAREILQYWMDMKDSLEEQEAVPV